MWCGWLAGAPGRLEPKIHDQPPNADATRGPTGDAETRYYVVTHWRSVEDFESWVASDDFGPDTSWDGDPGSWVMDEHVPLPDGRTLNIHAAGPHRHKSDFYVFVMDREDGNLEFPELTSGPRLTTITLAGGEAPWWRERLGRWLRLPPSASGGGLMAGGTELVFTPGPAAAVRATLAFSDAARSVVLPLGAGAIELAGSPAL